ncbi:MAG: hypothetical protein K6T78_12960 [Alicyclobacillus sp.]|nr:hypothetical protein [Alicyclobacillus sp.]
MEAETQVKTWHLHISLYEMPDGMWVASCAEVPHCRILRQNREHAFTDARKYVLQFLREREAEGRPFEVPEVREVEFRLAVPANRMQHHRVSPEHTPHPREGETL